MPEKDAAFFAELVNAVKNFDAEAAQDAATRALQAGVDPIDALEKGLNKGLKDVGQRYEKGELFIVHLIAAAETMKSAVAILRPKILEAKEAKDVLGRVVIGTVEGDIHDIGKNIVSVMLTAAGFEVHDIGKDVPTERFVETAKENRADIIGASSLLTTSMPAQRHIANAISKAGLNAKYIVGGAAVSEQWAKEINASYASDAPSAVQLSKRLLK